MKRTTLAAHDGQCGMVASPARALTRRLSFRSNSAPLRSRRRTAPSATAPLPLRFRYTTPPRQARKSGRERGSFPGGRSVERHRGTDLKLPHSRPPEKLVSPLAAPASRPGLSPRHKPRPLRFRWASQARTGPAPTHPRPEVRTEHIAPSFRAAFHKSLDTRQTFCILFV